MLLINPSKKSYMSGIIYFYSAFMFWSRIRFRIIQRPSSAKIVLEPLERFDIRSYCLRLIVLRIISKWVLVSRQVVCQWARCWDTLVRRLGARARRTVHFPQDNLPARILQTLTDSSANRFCIVSLTAPAVIYSPEFTAVSDSLIMSSERGSCLASTNHLPNRLCKSSFGTLS